VRSSCSSSAIPSWSRAIRTVAGPRKRAGAPLARPFGGYRLLFGTPTHWQAHAVGPRVRMRAPTRPTPAKGPRCRFSSTAAARSSQRHAARVVRCSS
jgi:hypothetical protein